MATQTAMNSKDELSPDSTPREFLERVVQGGMVDGHEVTFQERLVAARVLAHGGKTSPNKEFDPLTLDAIDREEVE